MRAPNFYSHPGSERAGLRRRDTGWIVERVTDPGSIEYRHSHKGAGLSGES